MLVKLTRGMASVRHLLTTPNISISQRYMIEFHFTPYDNQNLILTISNHRRKKSFIKLLSCGREIYGSNT